MLRVFFGHHKCASRYFRMSVLKPAADAAGLLVVQYAIKAPPFHFRRLDALDFENIDFKAAELNADAVLCLSNASARVVEKVRQRGTPIRALRVLRDPRQILASNYFHHLSGHDTRSKGWVWDQLIEDRVLFKHLSLEDGLMHELNHITRDLLDNQIFAWTAPEDTLEIRLEDFGADPAQGLHDIGRHLQLPVDADAIPSNRFANTSAQSWRECFTDRIKDAFKERYGEGLIRLGYETSLNW